MTVSGKMKPKKSLGQYFLKNRAILRKIALACNLKPGERVVEIGAGSGSLTEELIKIGAEVAAIEKDKNLCQILQDKFGQLQSFRLVCDDVLRFNPEKYFKGRSYKISAIFLTI
jgi:16S rRNA (adenine1518-N6/adenine1519-N6)-dimethyltransferase